MTLRIQQRFTLEDLKAIRETRSQITMAELREAVSKRQYELIRQRELTQNEIKS